MDNVQISEASVTEVPNETDKRRREKLDDFKTEPSETPNETSKMVVNKVQILNSKPLPQIRDLINSAGSILTNQSFLSDHELKLLLTEASDGFMFIARCGTGQITYASDTIYRVLNVRQEEWLTSTLFAQIHPADITKVKEYLTPAKSMLASTTSTAASISQADSDEARRTFTCRMKLRPGAVGRGKYKNFPNVAKHSQCYALIQCNGLIKKWPCKQETEAANEDQYCLVATAKIPIAPAPSRSAELEPNAVQQFTSRHSLGGSFIFVDQRITTALGYTTVELLGKRFFDFFYRDDRRFIKETFKFIPSLKGKSMTVTYRFWSKVGYWVWLRSTIYAFVNPYSGEMEYIICECSVLPHDVLDSAESSLQDFNMAFTNKSSSNYRHYHKDRHSHHPAMLQPAELPQNNDPMSGFLLPVAEFTPDASYSTAANQFADSAALLNDKSAPFTGGIDWSQFNANPLAGTSLPALSDWSLPPVVDLCSQQENWPILSANNWPPAGDNDLNNALCPPQSNNLDQLDSLWKIGEENLWPSQFIDTSGNSSWQFPDGSIDFNNLKAKSNWPDLENFDCFNSLSYINSSNNSASLLSRSNTNYSDFGSGTSAEADSQQSIWTERDTALWTQTLRSMQSANCDNNDVKSLGDIDIASLISVTNSSLNPNLPWKEREENVYHLAVPTTANVPCQTDVSKTLIDDQSKLPKLPDLIEQVLHVDHSYRQGST